MPLLSKQLPSRLTLFVACLLAGCSIVTQPPVNVPDYPEVITVERGGFTPGGIEYDHANRLFLSGSFIEGRIYALASDDNGVSAWIVATAPQGAASTVARIGDAMYVVYPHFADQEPPTVEKVNFIQQ